MRYFVRQFDRKIDTASIKSLVPLQKKTKWTKALEAILITFVK